MRHFTIYIFTDYGESRILHISAFSIAAAMQAARRAYPDCDITHVD